MGKRAIPPEPKKPYSTPVLTVYGTVRDLTKAVGNRRSKDGGKGNTSRTSL